MLTRLSLLWAGAVLIGVGPLIGGPAAAAGDPMRCDASAVNIRGYAGSTVEDETGKAVIHLWLTSRDEATQAASLKALRGACPGRYSSTRVVVHDAQYTLSQLQDWSTTATSTLGSDDRATLSYVDVERNSVVVGVLDLERNGPTITADLRTRGVPSDALRVVEASIRQMPARGDSLMPAIAGVGVATAAVALGAYLLWIRGRRRRSESGPAS